MPAYQAGSPRTAAPIWKRKRPKSLGKPVPLTPKQKAAAKAMAQAAGRTYPNLVDNIAASRLENPTMKKPTPAQLAARARFAEMARSGAFKKKAAKARKAKANPAKKTVSQKISQLTREGYPQKQAVAIALSEERAGKVKRNPITETLIYGLPAGETRDYMEELLYDGGLKLTPEQIQKVLAAATAAGYHSFRVTGFDPTIGAAFVRTMGQTRQRKRNPRASNPATGEKRSRTKLNPASGPFRYVLVVDDGGFTYGMDDRTPVQFMFSNRDRKQGVYRSFSLPNSVAGNPAFQDWARFLPEQSIVTSLSDLRKMLKVYA